METVTRFEILFLLALLAAVVGGAIREARMLILWIRNGRWS